MSPSAWGMQVTGDIMKIPKEPCIICENESDSCCSTCSFCVLCHIAGRFDCMQITEYTYLDRLPPKLQTEQACRECGSRATTGIREGRKRSDKEFYLCAKHVQEYQEARA